jgi:hypothetical protein
MKMPGTRVFLVLALMPCLAAAAPAQSPGGKANQRVTVVGKLQFAGSNYYLDSRFAIVDDSNTPLYVTTWAPIEIPPPPPGQDGGKSTKKINTMQDFVGRRLAVSGIYRSGVDLPEKAKAVAAPGQDFLEVDSVTDPAAGTTLYSATLPSQPRPIGSPAGETKTGIAAPARPTPQSRPGSVPKSSGKAPATPPNPEQTRQAVAQPKL